MEIIGVSFDSTAANQAWAVAEGYQYELWSDLDRELAMYYGAAVSPTQGAASRITVVLDATGTLVLEYRSGINVGTHPALVLDDCRLLFGP